MQFPHNQLDVVFAVAVELFKFFNVDELAIDAQPLIALALGPVC